MLEIGLSIVALALAPLAAPPAPVRPLLIAADNLRTPTGVWTDATRPSAVVRVPHSFGEGALSEVRFGYCGWWIDTNGAETDVASWQLDAAAMEVNGVALPIAFSGARTIVLAGGETLRLSDPIYPAAAGLSAFPASGGFFERAKARMIGGAGLPVNAAPAQGFFYPTASDSNAIDATGALSTPAGAQGYERYPAACLIVGRYAASGKRAVVALGTSISTAYGDGSGGDGFVKQALHGDGSAVIAGLVMSQSQTTVAAYTGSNAKRRALMAYANVLHDEYGTNDLAQGASAAATLAASRQLWRDARAAGVQRVVKTTVHARTGSSDGWTTRANQSPIAGFGSGGALDTLNAAYAGAAEVDAVADQFAALGDAADGHAWKSPASTPAAAVLTGDGIHPNGAGHALMAPVSRAALLGVAVDANAGAPVNLAAPAYVGGVALVGVPLAYDGVGAWKEAYGASYSYQHRRNGVDIPGATAAGYTPVAGDAGATLTRVTTATTGSGATSVISSGPVHVWPAFGSALLTDRLGGAGALTSHTSDSGHGWANIVGTDSWYLSGGALYASNAAFQAVLSSAVVPTNDQTLYVEGNYNGAAAQLLVFQIRCDAAGNNYWRFDIDGPNLHVYAVAGGGYVYDGGAFAHGFAVGQSYAIAFSAIGNVVTLQVNGATVFTVTNGSIAGGSRMILYEQGAQFGTGFRPAEIVLRYQ